MSDILKDYDTLVDIREAMLAHVTDCAALDWAVEAGIRAILARGYRIVKPAFDPEAPDGVEFKVLCDEGGGMNEIPESAFRLPPEFEIRARALLAAKWEADGLVGEAQDVRENGVNGWSLVSYDYLLAEAAPMLVERIAELEDLLQLDTAVDVTALAYGAAGNEPTEGAS